MIIKSVIIRRTYEIRIIDNSDKFILRYPALTRCDSNPQPISYLVGGKSSYQLSCGSLSSGKPCLQSRSQRSRPRTCWFGGPNFQTHFYYFIIYKCNFPTPLKIQFKFVAISSSFPVSHCI